ncbi:MAG: FecR domain-containing protein [Gemmatimonadaceae bacterium]
MHHPKPDGTNWERLAAYFAGECSAPETAELERWIDAEPGRRQLIERLREVWGRTGRLAGDPEPVDLDTAWSRMVARVRAHAAREGEEAVGRPRRIVPLRGKAKGNGQRHLSFALRAAGTIIVVAGAGLLWRAQTKRADIAPAAVQLRPMREYATAPGQRAVVRLADGTRIDMAVDSRLRVPTDFGTATREVYLEGEAYLAVASDPRRPFIVHTARGTARALGTKFNVHAYAGDAGLTVVVAEGMVALKAAPVRDTAYFPGIAKTSGRRPAAVDSVILREADLGRLDAEGHLSVERDVDVDAHLAWTQGRLLFANVPLREVIPRLNRWYDIDVRLGDSSLADYPYTASLTDESLPQVLQLLSTALEVRIEQRGKTVTLHRSRASR